MRKRTVTARASQIHGYSFNVRLVCACNLDDNPSLCVCDEMRLTVMKSIFLRISGTLWCGRSGKVPPLHLLLKAPTFNNQRFVYKYFSECNSRQSTTGKLKTLYFYDIGRNYDYVTCLISNDLRLRRLWSFSLSSKPVLFLTFCHLHFHCLCFTRNLSTSSEFALTQMIWGERCATVPMVAMTNKNGPVRSAFVTSVA